MLRFPRLKEIGEQHNLIVEREVGRCRYTVTCNDWGITEECMTLAEVWTAIVELSNGLALIGTNNG